MKHTWKFWPGNDDRVDYSSLRNQPFSRFHTSDIYRCLCILALSLVWFIFIFSFLSNVVFHCVAPFAAITTKMVACRLAPNRKKNVSILTQFDSQTWCSVLLSLPSCLPIHVDIGSGKDIWMSATIEKESATLWGRWAALVMAQQERGGGADRIQGFRAAPVVDWERGKTLKIRGKERDYWGRWSKSKALISPTSKVWISKKCHQEVSICKCKPTCCPKKEHLRDHSKNAGHKNPWQEKKGAPLKMSAVCFNLIGTSSSPFSHPSQKGNRVVATQGQNRGVEIGPGEVHIVLSWL